MKFLLLWFTVAGMPIVGLPDKTFDTQAECAKFADGRVGIVSLRFNLALSDIKFECRAIPFIEPKL